MARWKRWWQGNAPEWDLVSDAEDGEHVLLAEIKWSEKPFSMRDLQRLVREATTRPLPPSLRASTERVARALCVPCVDPGVPRKIDGVHIITGEDLFNA